MSKFLKFIVHLCIIGVCICALGLFVPQFFGVTTVIMDNEETVTNLPMGSVTYAIPVEAEAIKIGDPILVQEDSKTYRYNVASLDLQNHTGTVINPAASGSELITVSIRSYLPKVVITIGWIGYLLVALRSKEGLMIVGLVVLALIILYVLSEILRKDPSKDEEFEIEDPAPGQVKSKKELKKEEKMRARRLKEEEEAIRLEEKKNKKDKKKQKSNKKMIRTGGFVDEIEDDEDDDLNSEADQTIQTATAASEAHELLKKEIAAATADPVEEEPILFTIPVEEKTKDVVTEVKAQMNVPEEKEVLTTEEIGKLAIPVYSASQLAEQAKRAGDNPDMVRDDVTEVTLFDYSDIIGSDD